MLTKVPRKSSLAVRNAAYVVCISNEGYEVSLEPRKLYEVIADSDAEKHDQLRIVDESGENYLYPARHFAAIRLPIAISRALRKTT